jgi:hypothetical protein
MGILPMMRVPTRVSEADEAGRASGSSFSSYAKAQATIAAAKRGSCARAARIETRRFMKNRPA